MFMPRYKEQMIEMMLTVIEHACDPEKDHEGQKRRIKHLEKQMDVMRRAMDSWDELIELCVNSNDQPPVMFRKIIDEISAAGEGLGVSEVPCMCTYVTNVCVKLVSKNEKNMVGEMVETMVDYLLHQGYMACVNCLYWLDSL